MILRDKLAEIIPGLRKEANEVFSLGPNAVIGEVTTEQLFGGMRGIKSLICDTSEVGLDTGLIIRGIPVLELTDKLPEEIFYLLLTGELPDDEALEDLQWELRRRADVPFYVWNTINALPMETHPMVMLNSAVLVMENESFFKKRYAEGMPKDMLWEPMLWDALNLIARMPIIAAYIYRRKFNKGPRINPDNKLDWAENYARLLGVEDPDGSFADLMRLYMVLHADHEGGNVSALVTQTINSALSDIYFSVSGGLNGLAGPLHGLANQDCLNFILKLRDDIGHTPSDGEVKEYCQNLLNNKRVIAGYGHAVLRVTDPRFTAFVNFGNKYFPDDEIFGIVKQLYNIVPKLLIEGGKAKDPWPNVDAASGALLHYYGMTEYEYYTVLFSVSRVLGLAAQLILNRALYRPIIRPKSVTTAWLKKQLSAKKKEEKKEEPKEESKPKDVKQK
ncbi:MAG: citrate (Si)-synthase [Ignavibacteria bacterium]|jgi:citrate synthase|nr:citrate (Si)-synthase [Ignavibacteria bacterium]